MPSKAEWLKNVMLIRQLLLAYAIGLKSEIHYEAANQAKKNISIQSLKNDFTFYRQLRLLDFLFSLNCFKNHKNGNFLTKTNLTRLSVHSLQ